MIELFWAWRLLFGQITIDDVPEPLKCTVMRWYKELNDRKTNMVL